MVKLLFEFNYLTMSVLDKIILQQKRKMKKKHIVNYLSVITMMILFFSSCVQRNIREPLKEDSTPPAPVTNVTVENLHGAAKISYDIPKDLDLLYVKANYEIREGVKEEKRASFYGHNLTVEGFGDTVKHEVTLVAVDRSGNESEGTKITIKPLISPVQVGYSSLSYIEDFGGINVSYENPSGADLITTIMTRDFTGEWKEYSKNYTSQSDVNFSVRGLPPVTATFGVFIRDKWNNYSDTLIKDLTPLKEIKLNKKKFSVVNLPNDAEIDTWPIESFWDDYIWGGSGMHTTGNTGLPAWVTIDLGVTARLSRIRIWQVHDGREYSGGNIRQFELWGSNYPDTISAHWTLLQSCEIVKPSGLPMGELSNEDVREAEDGHEFSIPADAPSVRYIRLKIISTFTITSGARTGSTWAREITFWGQD